MKKKILVLILMVVLVMGVLPSAVFAEEIANERQYELPGYQTYIKVSNVVSDNSNDYITIRKFEAYDGRIIEHKIASNLNIDATAPCKVTYGLGEQYIHYAIKMEDGS